MNRSRYLIATGYLLSLLLLVMPLLQPVVTLLPVQLGVIRWRLQAFGALSQVLILPLIGFGLAVATAMLLEQRKVARLLSVLSFLSAVALIIGNVLFTLDLVQYRTSIGLEMREFYTIAAIVYLLAYTLGSAFLFWLAAVTWRAAGRRRKRAQLTRAAVEQVLETALLQEHREKI